MNDTPSAIPVYLDANTFIYAIESSGEEGEAMRTLLTALREHRGAAVTSELTLAEVLAPSSGVRRDGDLKRLYLNLLVWSGFVRLDAVSRDVLFDTTKLRAVAPRKLSLPDAIHLCTAVRARCRYFVTRDKGFSTPEGMQVVRPDRDGAKMLVEALST